MKKYISHLVFALLGCTALSACVDDDYMELDKGQNELVLTASKTEVVLNEQAHADDALELSWTTGTNYGTGNKSFLYAGIGKTAVICRFLCSCGECRTRILMEKERGGIE